MSKLQITKMPCGNGMDTMRIAGFADGELSELKSMEHHEARGKLLEMLDSRNNGTGAVWLRCLRSVVRQ